MAKHKYATSPPNLTGMPPGVPYIIGNEAAERFSYYGMKSVLTVFMAHYILNQSGVLAPMSSNEAYMYSALLRFRRLFSSDSRRDHRRWLVRANIGRFCRSRSFTAWEISRWRAWPLPGESQLGNAAMLAIGLFLICLGAGGIKPCVSANVGDQFGESNKHLLSKMFGWFYFSINAGSFISSHPLSLASRNPKWGPGWAFGIPGIAMLIATLFFWGGRKKMVHVPPAGLGYFEKHSARKVSITLARIAMVYVFILVFWALWGMSNGVEWTLQAEKMDLHVSGCRGSTSAFRHFTFQADGDWICLPRRCKPRTLFSF